MRYASSCSVIPHTSSYCYKAVQLVQDAKDHKVIDALVLFILYTIPTRRKAVENLFVAKIKSKHFTVEYLDVVFGIGPKVYVYSVDAYLSIYHVPAYVRTYMYVCAVCCHVYIRAHVNLAGLIDT